MPNISLLLPAEQVHHEDVTPKRSHAQDTSSALCAALGIDIGGTNHTAALVAPDGKTLEILRGRTDREGGPEALLGSLESLVGDLLDTAVDYAMTVAGVGVGFGGPVDVASGRVIRSHHVEGWDDFPLQTEMQQRVGLPVVLDNDANAGGWGEYCFGAGMGCADMVYYNIGTGIGGALILSGKLLRGPDTTAGELGHMTVNPSGPLCSCGQRGCLEAVSSGSAITREVAHRCLVWQGRPATAEDLFTMIRSGSDEAAAILADVVEGLRISIRNILHCLNPEAVVIGGGVSRGGEALLAPLRAAVAATSFPAAAARCRISAASLGYDAGVIGAAALVLRPPVTV